MDVTTIIRAVAGVAALIIAGIILYRRKKAAR
jgi:LPXTG-motif cell wall-anchored protein